MCLSWADCCLFDLLVLYEFVKMTVCMSMFKSDIMLHHNLVSHIGIACQQPFPNTQKSLGLNNALRRSYSCIIVLSLLHPSLMSVLQYLWRLSLSLIHPQISGLAWACGVLHWSFSALLIQKSMSDPFGSTTHNHHHISQDQIRAKGKKWWLL